MFSVLNIFNVILFNLRYHQCHVYMYACTVRCDDISNLWRSLLEQLEERRKRLEVAAGLFKVFEEMKTILQSMEEIKVTACITCVCMPVHNLCVDWLMRSYSPYSSCL